MNRLLRWLAKGVLLVRLGLALWMAGLIASIWLGGWAGVGVAIGFLGAILWAHTVREE